MIEKMKKKTISIFDQEPLFNKNFYTWDDMVYRDFMIGVLMNLEPISYHKS